jgi:hypothetical protein
LLHVRRQAADAHRHDHLMVTVDGWLAVVALQIGAAGLHEMVVGIGEVAGSVRSQ